MNVRTATTKLGFALVALAGLSMAASDALAGGPARSAKAILVADFLTTPDGALDSPDDLLYDLDPCDASQPDVLSPVLAPDGHHLTLGEYDRVRGKASLKCRKEGTHVEIRLSGLVPNGVYTIWLLTFQAPGFTPDFANLIGEGSLGAPDGTTNTLVASRHGRAVIRVRQPAGALSEFGTVGACLFDEYEFHLVGAYHPDGQTYGPTPGPLADPADPASVQYCYFVEHFGFVFVPGLEGGSHEDHEDDRLAISSHSFAGEYCGRLENRSIRMNISESGRVSGSLNAQGFGRSHEATRGTFSGKLTAKGKMRLNVTTYTSSRGGGRRTTGRTTATVRVSLDDNGSLAGTWQYDGSASAIPFVWERCR